MKKNLFWLWLLCSGMISGCSGNDRGQMSSSVLSNPHTSGTDFVPPTTVFEAIRARDIEAVKTLLNPMDDLSAQDFRGPEFDTPLHLTLRLSLPTISQYLVEQPQLNIRKLNGLGESYIYLASLHGDVFTVRKLIERFKSSAGLFSSWREVDPPLPANQEIALHVAGHPEILKMLSEVRPSDFFKQDKDGLTPFLSAARAGRTEALQWFIDQFCRAPQNVYDLTSLNILRQIDSHGRSVLMIAAQYGSLQAVKLLTDCAFISKNNSKDQMGSTVLHYAALNRDPDNEVYRFLLRTLPQGAEAIKNNQHLTPADILRCEINRRAGIPCNN